MSDLLNEASLVLIPSGIKASKVYAQIPEDGSGDMTFSRASDATRVNSLGLVEKVRTNLFTYSNDFTNGAWFKDPGIVITQNATTAPDGTMTASLMDYQNTSISMYRYPQSPNITYTMSMWVKAYSGYSGKKIGLVNGTSTKPITLTNDWVRVDIIGSATTPNIEIYNRIEFEAIKFYLWGAQFEVSDFGPTAYIPTTSSAVSVGPYSNIPRLNYQNGGGGCPSLLLEAQRTNLWINSENVNLWGRLQCDVIPNEAISPDGYQNADRIDYQNYNGQWDIVYQGTFTATGIFSIWLKTVDGSTKTINLTWGPPDPSRRVIWTVTGEWQRFSAQINPSAQNVHLGNINNLDPTWTARSFYAWGAQFEEGSYISSYIPTLGTSVTRVADACYKTGISSLIGQTEGVIFIDVQYESLQDDSRYAILSDGTFNNRIVIYQSGGNINVYCSAGATFNLQYNPPSGRLKIAFAYKSGQYALYVNGVNASSSTESAVPSSLTAFGISANEVLTTAAIGEGYNEAILFPTRLTNSQLAELTA